MVGLQAWISVKPQQIGLTLPTSPVSTIKTRIKLTIRGSTQVMVRIKVVTMGITISLEEVVVDHVAEVEDQEEAPALFAKFVEKWDTLQLIAT